MKRMMAVFIVFVMPAVGLAQTELMRTTDGSSVTAEVLLPIFKNGPGYTYRGMTILLSGKVVVTDMISVHAEVPYVQSTMKYSNPFGSISASHASVGNTYVGIGIGSPNGVVSGDFGVRLNTLTENSISATISGLYGDLPNIERYMGDVTSIHAGINVHTQILDQLTFLARFAPSLWRESIGDGDNMWFSHYGLGAAYQINVVRIGAGVNGLWKMSDGGFLFENKDALHHFQAEINARFGMIRPAVMFRVPLDKELNMVSSTVGISTSLFF